MDAMLKEVFNTDEEGFINLLEISMTFKAVKAVVGVAPSQGDIGSAKLFVYVISVLMDIGGITCTSEESWAATVGGLGCIYTCLCEIEKLTTGEENP